MPLGVWASRLGARYSREVNLAAGLFLRESRTTTSSWWSERARESTWSCPCEHQHTHTDTEREHSEGPRPPRPTRSRRCGACARPPRSLSRGAAARCPRGWYCDGPRLFDFHRSLPEMTAKKNRAAYICVCGWIIRLRCVLSPKESGGAHTGKCMNKRLQAACVGFSLLFPAHVCAFSLCHYGIILCINVRSLKACTLIIG